MPFAVVCPFCGCQDQGLNALGGRRVKCLQCRQLFFVLPASRRRPDGVGCAGPLRLLPVLGFLLAVAGGILLALGSYPRWGVYQLLTAIGLVLLESLLLWQPSKSTS
jgi:hypothetical protein